MSSYSLQISFRYWKRHSKGNSKIRHHRRINTFSDFHGGYISDGRVLGFRNYISPYSEECNQKKKISIIELFLTLYQSSITKVRTACRCIRLLCRYEIYYFFCLFTNIFTLHNDASAPLCSCVLRHVDNDGNIALVAVIFTIC